MTRFTRLLGIAACVLPLFTMATAHSQAPDEYAGSIHTLLASERLAILRDANFSRDREAIEQLYNLRQHRAVWFANGELTRQGVLLLQTLRGADEYGLNPDDYDGTQLIYYAIDLLTNRSAPVSDRAELDLGMTIAAARLLRHLHFGRINPRSAGFDPSQPRAPFDVSATLNRLATDDNFAQTLESVEPSFLHYQLLKRAMNKYRLLAVERELTELPSFKARSIKPGDEYEGVPALRRLLIALGDIPAGAVTSDTVLDQTLTTGIMIFQLRHGLSADGALGRKTFAALTTPLSVRARQLALGLERWRWLPEFSSPPIVVNIPQFRLFAFREPKVGAADFLQMDVIVGKTYPTTRTPAFTAELKYVVFRPYWDVPPSIQREEMLPQIRADLNYLDQNDLEIVSNSDTNGRPIAPSPEAIEQLAAGTLRLRQRPGNENSLGLVKLMLPNPYNVYLHSTPVQRLFSESRRAFSHGCIRLSDPAGLVEHVLRNEPGQENDKWTREKIEAAMHDESPQGNNRHVFLSKPIPVLIVYGTAMVMENGDVQFFEDLYGHDEILARLLRAQGTRL